MRPNRIVARAVSALASLAAASALAVTIELPKEATQLKDAPGFDLVQRTCSVCHSYDYIAIQPPGKPHAFWKAEVEKMKKVYGASIPDDQIEPIAQYLTRAYGDGK